MSSLPLAAGAQTSSPRRSRWFLATAFIALYLASVVPICAAKIPPIVDYPNHLARVRILSQWHNSQIWPEFYTVEWKVLPNLAFDAFGFLVTPFLGVELSGRLFLVLILLLLFSGTIALHYATFRQVSLWPAFSSLFLYNWIFLYGFLNYLFGIGLALWALAVWMLLRQCHSLLRVAVATILATTVFFSHLAAFALYSLMVCGLELYSALQRRRARSQVLQWSEMILGATQFVVPAALFLFLSPTTSEFTRPQFSSPVEKILYVIAQLRTGTSLLDYTLMMVSTMGVVVLVWRRTLRVDRQMLVVAGILCLCFAVAPSQLATTKNLDMRLPILIFFVFVAAVQPTGRCRTAERWVLLAVCGAVLLRGAVLSKEWRDCDQIYDRYRVAFRTLEPGSTLFTAAPAGAVVHRIHEVSFRRSRMAYPDGWSPPLRHVANLAILEREVFVPQTFAYAAQQPLGIHSSASAMAALQSPDPVAVPSAPGLTSLLARAWEVHEETSASKHPARRLGFLWLSEDDDVARSVGRLTGAGPGFRLFEVTPVTSAGAADQERQVDGA